MIMPHSPSSFANWRRPSRLGLAGLAAWFLLGGQPGCLVDEKCYADSDCAAPEVCGTDGECEFQCRVDSDCEDNFGAGYFCDANHCRYSVECTLCSFDHAAAVCIHGTCHMGACEPGFHDLNQEQQDGCEYACTQVGDGTEICDGVDNDCDGLSDENTDLDSDPDNCGSCGNVCLAAEHAETVCASGRCAYTCHVGWYDNNGLAADGCEAAECVASKEVCDGRDNDCDCPGDTNGDGVGCGPGDDGVDEGFDKTLSSSCGPFCAVCAYDHAEPLCIDGACAMGACESGWYDVDGSEATGCEYPCTPTGDEVCDSIDNDCDGRIDEGVCVCPDDMVAVGAAFCVDRYEASRRDATDTDPGLDESLATSRPGVLPWMVRPMTAEQLATFQSACAAAGKRLCTADEWFATCTGPEETYYVYGSSFDNEVCNCVDTFCDDYCAENGIPPAQCSTGDNCGYAYNCFRAVPTGEFADCTNEYGTLDINGNVWEIVLSASDSRGYEVRGGAFNCASALVRVSCSFNASWSDLYAGFRCCKDTT
jgi:hypothetical protein